MLRHKLIRAETKLLDEDSGQVSAVLSTETRDRDGDIIRAAGWNLREFEKHPVLLSSHNYYSLQSQIGEWQDVEIRGKRLVGVARYFVGEGNAEADWGFNLAKHGRAAYSVGFVPDMDKAKPLNEKDAGIGFAPMEFNGQTLLECSHVTVPSNPDALQRMKHLALPPELKEIVDEMQQETDIPKLAEQVAELVLAGIDYDAIAKSVADVRTAEEAAEVIEAAKQSVEGDGAKKGLARW